MQRQRIRFLLCGNDPAERQAVYRSRAVQHAADGIVCSESHDTHLWVIISQTAQKVKRYARTKTAGTGSGGPHALPQVWCFVHHSVRSSLFVPRIGCDRPQSRSCGGSAMPSTVHRPLPPVRRSARPHSACCAPSTQNSCVQNPPAPAYTRSVFITASLLGLSLSQGALRYP